MPAAATLYDWLELVHVVAAMVWLGGLVTLTALGVLTRRSGQREAIARFVGSLRVIGPIVLAPASLSVVGFGIWLIVDSEAWDFGQTWVWLALVLFSGAFLVGATFLSRAAIGAQRAAAAGDDDEAARQLGRWAWGSGAIVVLLVVAAWDMVMKPSL
jgi:uncharacterized membrane protein